MKHYNINSCESLSKSKDITKEDDLREAVLYEYDATTDLNKNVVLLTENKPLSDIPEYRKDEFLTEKINF